MISLVVGTNVFVRGVCVSGHQKSTPDDLRVDTIKTEHARARGARGAHSQICRSCGSEMVGSNSRTSVRERVGLTGRSPPKVQVSLGEAPKNIGSTVRSL